MDRSGQGGYSTGFIEIVFWTGLGKIWQTQSRNYFGARPKHGILMAGPSKSIHNQCLGLGHVRQQRAGPGYGHIHGSQGRGGVFVVGTVIYVPGVSTHFYLFVECWPTRESFGMARGPRLWALGVDSGPRGGSFDRILDPHKS